MLDLDKAFEDIVKHFRATVEIDRTDPKSALDNPKETANSYIEYLRALLDVELAKADTFPVWKVGGCNTRWCLKDGNRVAWVEYIEAALPYRCQVYEKDLVSIVTPISAPCFAFDMQSAFLWCEENINMEVLREEDGR